MRYIMGLFFLFCVPLFGMNVDNVEKLDINITKTFRIFQQEKQHNPSIVSTWE